MRHPVLYFVILLCCYFGALAMPVRSTGGAPSVPSDLIINKLKPGSIVQIQLPGTPSGPSIILEMNETPGAQWFWGVLQIYTSNRERTGTRLDAGKVSERFMNNLRQHGCHMLSSTVLRFSEDTRFGKYIGDLGGDAFADLRGFATAGRFAVIDKFAHTTYDLLVLDKVPEDGVYEVGDMMMVQIPPFNSPRYSVVVQKLDTNNNPMLYIILLHAHKTAKMVTAAHISIRFLDAISMAQMSDPNGFKYIHPGHYYKIVPNSNCIIVRTRFRMRGGALDDLCKSLELTEDVSTRVIGDSLEREIDLALADYPQSHWQ